MKEIRVSVLLCLLGMVLLSQKPSLIAQTSVELDSLLRVFPSTQDSNRVKTGLHIATYFVAFKQLDSAEVYRQHAVEAATSENLPFYLAISKDMEGQILGLQGEYARSIAAHMAAAEQFRSLGDSAELSISLNNIANIYIYLHAYDQALEALLHALTLSETYESKEEVSGTLLNIAIVYRSLEQPELAKPYVLRALQHAEGSKNPFVKISVLMTLASTFMDLGQVDSAEWAGYEGYALALRSKSERYQRASLMTLTQHQLDHDDPEKAQHYLKLYGDPELDPDLTSRVYWHNYQAEIYWKTGRQTEAIRLAEKQFLLAKEQQELALLNNAHEQLYRFYKGLGQFEAALLHHEQYLAYQDSLFKNGQQEEIRRLEVVHQTEQMQDEILKWQQKAEIESLKVQQRNFGILFLLGLFALLGAWIIFRNRHRLLKEQFHRLQTEQRLLRSQTNPHFFFHALSGIQQFILQEKDLNQSIRYLSRFARLMRKVLEQSRTEEISLSEEIETLEHYLQLQQLRYDQKFTYEITVDPIIDPDWCQVPPLLLQPIVENAIEHGLAPKDGPGHLQILIREQVNGLSLMVEDNGVGRGHKLASPTSTRKSLATQIIQERLDLLRQQFGSAQAASLEVQDLTDAQHLPSGTLVTLRLPKLDAGH